MVVQDAPTRYAGLGWLAGHGFDHLRTCYHAAGSTTPMSVTVRAPILLGPAIALEYRTILVPVVSGSESREAIDLAARLATERGSTVVALRVIVVPMELPLEALLPEQEAEADQRLARRGARLTAETLRRTRARAQLVRSRNAGRAIVDEAERRQAEIIVLGAPRGRHRQIFGHTVDYVLKQAPCRRDDPRPEGRAA